MLGRPPLEAGQGLAIIPGHAIHTFFMPAAIDVLYLDQGGRVVRLSQRMPPWRIGPWVKRARWVLELPPGTIQDSGTQVGDEIVLERAKAQEGPLERFLEPLAELLYPSHCIGCRRPGVWLCPSCLDDLPLFGPPWCDRCGLPDQAAHRRCLAAPLRALRSVGPMKGILRAAVTRLKFHGQRVLAEPLGELLSRRLAAEAWPVDVIVPVPLHAQRRQERGFDQAELLGRQLSKPTGLPLKEGLIRTRSTRPQVGLSLRARQENLRQVFQAEGDWRGAKVLLVDDVCTTGSTLAACARALSEAGAAGVWALTVAREL